MVSRFPPRRLLSLRPARFSPLSLSLSPSLPVSRSSSPPRLKISPFDHDAGRILFFSFLSDASALPPLPRAILTFACPYTLLPDLAAILEIL